MANRIRLTKAERRQIYDKTQGNCAYCGQPLHLKDMQVDHVVPLRKGGADAIENMLPACRSCNHYKSTLSMEQFREQVQKIPDTLLRDSVTFKNGVRFGVVKVVERSVTFYFESEKVKEIPPQAGEGNDMSKEALICPYCGCCEDKNDFQQKIENPDDATYRADATRGCPFEPSQGDHGGRAQRASGAATLQDRR